MRAPLRFPSAAERAALLGAFGLALLAAIQVVFGLAGALRPLPLAGATLLAVAGTVLLARSSSAEPGGLSASAAGGLFAAALLPLLLLSIYPATGFDETLYHLPIVRELGMRGRIDFFERLRVPAFPIAAELLFLPPFLVLGDVGAHGVSALATALAALLAAGWAARLRGPRAGLVAAALLLGGPLVVYLGSTGYVDAPFALFATAAFWTLDRAVSERDVRFLALGCFLAGVAASTKYLGLYVVGVAGLVALAATVRARSAVPLGAALAGLLAGAGPLFGWLAAKTGNPVFPFAPGLFGASAWSTAPWEGGTRSLVTRLRDVALLPFDLLFRRGRTNRLPPLSPFLFAGLPLLLAGLRRERRLAAATAVLAGYAFCFAYLPRDARYLSAVLPLAAVAVAIAAADLVPESAGARKLPVTVLAALLVLLVAPSLVFAGRLVERRGAPPLGAAAREVYLRTWHPGYAAVKVFLDQAPAGARLYACGGEDLMFHASNRIAGDWMGLDRYDVVLPLVPAASPNTMTALPDPRLHVDVRNAERLAGTLRARGVSHLLVVRARCQFDVTDGTGFAREFRSVFEDTGGTLYEIRPDP